MTDNLSDQFNLGYTGKQGWGTLKARAYYEHTQHEMDFGDDKRFWYGPGKPPTGSGGDTAINGTPCSPISGIQNGQRQMVGCAAGMPMDTDGKNAGLTVSADIPLAAGDLLARRRRVPELSPGRLVGPLRRRHVALHLLEHQRWAARPFRRLRRVGDPQGPLDAHPGPALRERGHGCGPGAWLQPQAPTRPAGSVGWATRPGMRRSSMPRIPRQDRPQLGPVLARPFHARGHPDLRARPGAKDPLAQSVRALYLVHLADGGLHEQLRRRRQRLCGQPRSATGGRRHPQPHRRLARCRPRSDGASR